MTTFGIDLKKAIERNGMTVSEFARMVGVSQNAAGKWCNGDTFPQPKRWNSILKYTGLDCQTYADYGDTVTAPQGNAAINPHSSPMVHANGCSSVSVQGEVHHHQGHPAILDPDEAEILDMFRMIPARERVAVLRDCRKTLMGTIANLANRGTQIG